MNFTCPYCNQPTTITTPNQDQHWETINIEKGLLHFESKVGLEYLAIACPNVNCKKLFLTVELKEFKYNSRSGWRPESSIQEWQLLPESTAKPQPSYIPSQIVDDYNESCRIKSLSPKASATLARRCLQGMIRDFWGIKKDTLKLEIDELESHVTAEVWDAIDAVRSVGNIGAHMEKDVNVIIDIDPEEADLLLQLVEDLFADWYVVRHDRQERQKKMKAIALQKQAEKNKGSRPE